MTLKSFQCSTCGDERGGCPDCTPDMARSVYALAEYFNAAADVREYFGAQCVAPDADRSNVTEELRTRLARAEAAIAKHLR